MTRKFVDAAAFVALLFIGWLWITDAIGQSNGIQGLATGNGYPQSSTPTVGAGTGTTGAVTASITNAVGKFSYICGFSISTLEGVTAANTAPTVTGLVFGATFTYQIANAASTANTFSQSFAPCIPAASTGSAITVTSPANANATAVDVNVWGYQLPQN